MKPFLLFCAVVLGSFAWGRSDGTRLSPARIKPLKPANVAPAHFSTVSGTVTVRLNGVSVEPQSVTYVFSPEFPAHSGRLQSVGWGYYFMRADNVPMDQPYQLRISALYDDTVFGTDGTPEKRGRAHTGTLTLRIPYGTSYDFGVLFMDLR